MATKRIAVKRGNNVTIFGHTWVWVQGSIKITRAVFAVGFWESTDGNLVRIVPPSQRGGDWWVFVYDHYSAPASDKHNLRGKNVAERAFSVGTGYITQNRRSVK